MLDVSELECVRGDRRLFAGLSFALQPGELLHVAGPNGSGKTSLLRMLVGLAAPAAGTIRWDGHDIKKIGDDYYQGIAYLGHHNAIKDDLTALENLRVATTLAGTDNADARLEAALRRMGLPPVCYDLPTSVLSQGQKRRVALARLVLTEARLWVLDEPYTALDVGAIAVMQGLIGEQLTRGGMVILTTHQEVEISVGVVRRLSLAA